MLQLRKVALTAIGVLAVPALAGAWGECDERAPREASQDAAGVTRIVIDAGAGALHVRGREGISQVRASGTACAEDRRDLDEVRLEMTRSGDTLRIETVMPRGGDTRLDLDVDLPRGLALELEDTSGELEVEGVGDARIEDSSGSLEVSDVSGDLWIRDSSGSIDVRRVEGDVHIEDGSGSIEVEDVRGSVVVEDDGSGGIRIADVSHDVTIEEDGSGSIDVRDVGGDFRVGRDGSGEVRYHNVTGRVSLPRR